MRFPHRALSSNIGFHFSQRLTIFFNQRLVGIAIMPKCAQGAFFAPMQSAVSIGFAGGAISKTRHQQDEGSLLRRIFLRTRRLLDQRPPRRAPRVLQRRDEARREKKLRRYRHTRESHRLKNLRAAPALQPERKSKKSGKAVYALGLARAAARAAFAASLAFRASSSRA